MTTTEYPDTFYSDYTSSSHFCTKVVDTNQRKLNFVYIRWPPNILKHVPDSLALSGYSAAGNCQGNVSWLRNYDRMDKGSSAATEAWWGNGYLKLGFPVACLIHRTLFGVCFPFPNMLPFKVYLVGTFVPLTGSFAWFDLGVLQTLNPILFGVTGQWFDRSSNVPDRCNLLSVYVCTHVALMRLRACHTGS